jgi:hypothetical protein
MQQNPGATVTKYMYENAKLSTKPYIKAMSPDNLLSSFKKTGILPLRRDIFESIPESTALATIYANDAIQLTEDANQTLGEVGQSADQTGEVGQTSTNDEQNKENIHSDFLQAE